MSKTLKFLVAPDKFRGSLSASQAAHAIKMGILSEAKDAQIAEYTLTDGGDGFVDTISKAVKGAKVIRLKTIDPTGQVLTAKCALLDDDTALIGLTEASGINLVSDTERNPLKLTNIGTGQILEKLVERGYKSIIIGIGGSATNDGGVGLLAPLGFKFLDKSGNEISPNGEGLGNLDKVIAPEKKFNVKFTVATDVDAKLLGKTGASLGYSQSKGATESDVQVLEQNMKNLVEVAKKCGFNSAHNEEGAGAGGGCGYGLMTFLGAKRVSGFDIFAKYTGLDAVVKNCNVVITGEGKFDSTDTQGKGPFALAKLASKYKKPVWIFCGSSPLSQKEIDAMGIANMKVAQILPLAPNLVEAQNRAPKFLSHLAKEFVKEIV